MKRIFMLGFLLSSIGFSFGQVTTGSITTGSVSTGISNTTTLSVTGNFSEYLTSRRAILFSGIDQKRIEIQNKQKDMKLSFSGDIDFEILNGIGEISYSSLESKLLEDYISYKTSILNDYSSISSQLIILDEKVSFGVLTGDTLLNQKNKLLLDILAFEDKYKQLANVYYNNGIEKISAFSKNIESLKLSKKDTLTLVKNKQSKIADLNLAIEKFNKLNEKIQVIYVGNFDDINTFVKQLKDYSSNLLITDLNNITNQYYTKTPKLNYFSGDINSYNNGLLLALNNEIETYFNQILSGFYNQNEIDFINTNYKSFQSKYMTGDTYSLLVKNDDFDSVYEKLFSRIVAVNSSIEMKLGEFNSPSDIKDFKNNLKSKIESFYAKNKNDKINLFSGFISKQAQLLTYKLIDERTSYNNVNDKLYDMDNFTGTVKEKYDAYVALKSLYDNLTGKIISPELKTDVNKKKWEVEVKLIDTTVLYQKLFIYDTKYKNIDSTLKTILQNLYKKYIADGKQDIFNSKIDTSILKIDVLLNTSNTSNVTKYLLLKIKKAMISFRYL